MRLFIYGIKFHVNDYLSPLLRANEIREQVKDFGNGKMRFEYLLDRKLPDRATYINRGEGATLLKGKASIHDGFNFSTVQEITDNNGRLKTKDKKGLERTMKAYLKAGIHYIVVYNGKEKLTLYISNKAGSTANALKKIINYIYLTNLSNI